MLPAFIRAHTVDLPGGVPARIAIMPTTSADEFIGQLQTTHLGLRTRMLWLCNSHNTYGVCRSVGLRCWVVVGTAPAASANAGLFTQPGRGRHRSESPGLQELRRSRVPGQLEGAGSWFGALTGRDHPTAVSCVPVDPMFSRTSPPTSRHGPRHERMKFPLIL